MIGQTGNSLSLTASDKARLAAERKIFNPLDLRQRGQPDIRETIGDTLVSVAESLVGKRLEEDKANIIRAQMTNATMGYAGAIPMRCRGMDCQPPGTLISTNIGKVPIEDLSSDLHKLIGWDIENRNIRGGFRHGNIAGYDFSLYVRDYTGPLINISTEKYSHEVTKNHFCLARWSSKSYNAFAVYLMKRGDHWRIGKTKLFSNTAKGNFGPGVRACAEKADKLWILDICDTNTETLLLEEYFSVKLGIPKALFISSIKQKKAKQDGLYKWVTQEQLDDHHKSLTKDLEYYEKALASIGLDINYPIWERNKKIHSEINESAILGRSRTLSLRATNLISKYMEVPVMPETLVRGKHRNYRTEWNNIVVSKRDYSGPVYSLNVEKLHTYFANNIATHNCPFLSACSLNQANVPLPVGEACPIEKSVMALWITKHLKALGIEDILDPNNSFDMDMLYELSGQELIRWRCSIHLSDDPALVSREHTSSTLQGEPIFEDVINPVLEIMERAGRNIQKIREALVATREAQIRAGQDNKDPSLRAAELRQKAAEILKKKNIYLDRLNPEKIKDADFSVKEDQNNGEPI